MLKEPALREISRLNEKRCSINLEQVEQPISEPAFNASTVFIALKSALTRATERTEVPRHLNVLLHQIVFARSTRKLMQPVFVVGCGHSGTSIMLKILANHSKIFAVEGESDCFIWLGFVSKLRTFISWGRQTLQYGADRWAEKTPKHILYLDDIFNYFPDAKVVIMMRDGRDVALSQSATWGNFERCARRWVEEYFVAKKYFCHPNVTVVKYENLVRDSTETLHQLFQFLGEPFEPEVVHTERNVLKWYSTVLSKPDTISSATHSQYRNWQINQPLIDFTDKWVTQMSAEDRTTFKEIAGQVLIELGYAKDLNW